MPKGVEIRKNSLRVYFNYKNKKYREVVQGKPTVKNIAHARRLVASVNHEIKTGTFDYARWFPDSNHLDAARFAFYIDLWLEIIEFKVRQNTFRSYKGKTNKHIRSKWARYLPKDIDPIEIEKWVQTDLAYLSAKTVKEIIAIFQQIFAIYCKKNRQGYNPVSDVRVKMPDKEEPDPFTRIEIDTLLAYPLDLVQEYNLVKFMIWSGCRISEALAITWDCVDLKNKEVLINKSVDKVYHATKTKGSKRKISLLGPALEALQEQVKHSKNENPQEIQIIDRDNKTKRVQIVSFVFLNTHTGKPRTRGDNITRSFWTKWLNTAEIRYRPPGQCRHTYASQLLSNQVDISWLARQMGHVSTDMIYKHYAKFIIEDAPDLVTEINKKLKL